MSNNKLLSAYTEALKYVSDIPDNATHIVMFDICGDNVFTPYYMKYNAENDVYVRGDYRLARKGVTLTTMINDGSFPKDKCVFFKVPKKQQVYLAGDMLNRGAQMQRAAEKEEIISKGYKIYNPQDNKEINDKVNATQEGLAERIVKHDTDAILESDIVVIEPLAHALGTIAELGQIHGIKLMSDKIIDMVYCGDHVDSEETLQKILDLCFKQENKLVLPHNSDIRRTDIPEVGDRRSFAFHQYAYGLCLDLTNGKGVYEWDEVMKILDEDDVLNTPLVIDKFDNEDEELSHGTVEF